MKPILLSLLQYNAEVKQKLLQSYDFSSSTHLIWASLFLPNQLHPVNPNASRISSRLQCDIRIKSILLIIYGHKFYGRKISDYSEINQFLPAPVVQTIPRRKVAGIKEGLNVCQHCNAEVFSICTIRCIPKSISQNSASTCRFKLFDILIKQSIHKQFFRIRTSEPSEK